MTHCITITPKRSHELARTVNAIAPSFRVLQGDMGAVVKYFKKNRVKDFEPGTHKFEQVGDTLTITPRWGMIRNFVIEPVV
jgi:hypothetical protein